jgi:hypothetical protein
MYKRYALKFNKKQVEFINCVNMVERVKKARALNEGVSHLGVKRYVIKTGMNGRGNGLVIREWS